MKRPAADFDYEFIDGNILVIYDLDKGHRSVTNDIDNVIEAISKLENKDLRKFKIAYQDSLGTFDGVKVKESSVEIFSINGRSKEDVINYFINNDQGKTSDRRL